MTPPIGILAKQFAQTWPDGAEGVTTQPTVPAPVAAALDLVVAWWQSQRRGPELALLEAQAILREYGYGIIPPPSTNGTVTLPQDQTCLTSEQVEALMQTPDDLLLPCVCGEPWAQHSRLGRCYRVGCGCRTYTPQGQEVQACP